MSEIDRLRDYVKQEYTSLLHEDDYVANTSPTEEVIDFLNTIYSKMNMYSNIKEYSKDYVLTSKDEVVAELPVTPKKHFNIDTSDIFNPALFSYQKDTENPNSFFDNNNSDINIFGDVKVDNIFSLPTVNEGEFLRSDAHVKPYTHDWSSPIKNTNRPIDVTMTSNNPSFGSAAAYAMSRSNPSIPSKTSMFMDDDYIDDDSYEYNSNQESDDDEDPFQQPDE